MHELASEQSGSKQRYFIFYEWKTLAEAVIDFYLCQGCDWFLLVPRLWLIFTCAEAVIGFYLCRGCDWFLLVPRLWLVFTCAEAVIDFYLCRGCDWFLLVPRLWLIFTCAEAVIGFYLCRGCDWFLLVPRLWLVFTCAETVIGFYLCYPRRRKSNGTIFSSFLKYRKMAAVSIISRSFVVNRHLTALFFLSDFPITTHFLIILNGLPFSRFHFALLIVNQKKTKIKLLNKKTTRITSKVCSLSVAHVQLQGESFK